LAAQLLQLLQALAQACRFVISCLAFSGVLLSWAFVSRQRVSLTFRIFYVPLEERAVDVVASPAFDPVEIGEFPRLFADALVVRRLGFGETIDVPLTFAFRQSAPPVGDLFGRGAVAPSPAHVTSLSMS